MSNKSSNLFQHSYANMDSNDTHYDPLNIVEDSMLDDDYEPGNVFLHTVIILIQK